jgi:glycosyltransferase involved in cell wall biosynthesis
MDEMGIYIYREKGMKYPRNRQWAHDPEVVCDTLYRLERPTFSIVMPIHNQQAIIYDVLMKVFIHTHGLYDVFLILDGCTDNSRAEVLRAIQTIPPELCQLTIVSNPYGIFETSCDNLGFVNARGKYIVEIQADMQIQTSNYNVLLATPLEIYPDIIAVSGRCCHTLSGPFRGVGKISATVERRHNVPFDKYDQIFLSHTINRGPMVLRTSMVEKLGYLDEYNFILENDEHDLFYRAWTQQNWRTAFYPVEVYSRLAWGSTRKQRPADVQAYLDSRQRKTPNYIPSALPPALVTRKLPIESQYQAHKVLLH